MLTAQVRDFYASHSLTSDPGPLARRFDDLPVDVDELIDVVGGLLMHTHTAHDVYAESEPPDRGAGELTVMQMLPEACHS